MFISGCQDQSTSVSVAAMAATAAYINALSDEPEVMQLQCVLTPMLGVMHACLQRGKELSYVALFYESIRDSQSCNSSSNPHIKLCKVTKRLW